MRCVLGIDSGGTKCDAVVVRDDGTAISWGRTEYASQPHNNRNFGGFGRNPRAVGMAVRQALKGLKCEELHISGLMTFMPLGYWRESDIGCIHLHHVHEEEAAFALAGVTSGLVVLAGTGAFVYGITREGKEVHLDGMGPMVGDYGSGFQIGSLAVRAAAKASWSPRHATSLAEAVFSALKARLGDRGMWSLVEYMGGERDRAEVATLARVVNEEALKGDPIAINILKQVAGDISETVRDVVEQLEIADEEYTMVATGSVASRCDIYWEHLCGRVAEFAPKLTPWRSDLPPVLGLALIALNKLAAVDTATMRDNLFRSARETLAAYAARSEEEKAMDMAPPRYQGNR